MNGIRLNWKDKFRIYNIHLRQFGPMPTEYWEEKTKVLIQIIQKYIFGLTNLFRQESIISSSILVSKHLLSTTSVFPENKNLIDFEDFA